MIVCPTVTRWARRVTRCPTCDRRRRFVVMLQPWYDPIWTCCACGDAWAGGERLPRPFARGWRARESARARARWATAGRWTDAVRDTAEDY